MTTVVDVIAVGNAIVDVLGHTDDAFLTQHEVPKGGMILIDTAKAEEITGALKATAEVAGGSAGNSMACLASLGGRARFVGKVGDDDLGGVYRESMRAVGVAFDTAVHASIPTGRCLIAVTADAERSMATFLGAAGHVGAEDVTDDAVSGAEVTYLEGYLFEGYDPREAFKRASKAARAAGRKVALTLCDTGVVERQMDELMAFLKEGVDLLFANEAEAMTLTGTTDVDAAVEALRGLVPFAAVTRSEQGSIVFGPDEAPQAVPAVAPEQLIDTTGAGDAYAGGFLYGFTRGRPLTDCAKLGSLAASEVISHMGPRPEKSLKALAEGAGLL
ncbi:adenosine kinase [Parvularcula dongshanensis]|uniref:Sugar/nucleoside kinase (Ribokinase family) n=1 Tax=Parvularcula dongshanensis TaxID=1173995 RepID=A0A840I4T7_9PROT|nr:adenosine kinase [Parvularcula dongshanensis]MBB4659976.1 sugar/nucleoside kinase (ribokinase family) [Parvularcula dongshanensis]